jgi:hypothetical protein
VSLDICDEDQEKYDDIRSISRMNTVSLDWFNLSRGIIVIHPVFAILCYKIQWDLPYLFIVEKPPHKNSY